MTQDVVRIGDATLYHGDCLEILPTLPKVDAVITDPVWPNCPPGLLHGAEAPQELLQSALSFVTPIRSVIVLRSDSDPRFLAAVPSSWKFICVQAMSYAVPMYLGRVLGGTELAYCFGEPVPIELGRRVIPMWGPKAQPGDRPNNGHPCRRSITHQRWLVNWWSTLGETVLDPFMGSATCGQACVESGRKFIGIEIERKYFDIACERIDNAYRQARMFA
jgi:site-specific DNA-methyltransferase (adenine-specific)